MRCESTITDHKLLPFNYLIYKPAVEMWQLQNKQTSTKGRFIYLMQNFLYYILSR